MRNISVLHKTVVVFAILAVGLMFSSCAASSLPASSEEAVLAAASVVDEEDSSEVVAPDDSSDSSSEAVELDGSTNSDDGGEAEAVAEYMVSSLFLQRASTTYGELKEAIGAHEVVFEVNSQYFVLDASSGVAYYFRAQGWEESDADVCYKVEAELSMFVPDLREPMDLDEFAGMLHSEFYDAYYEIHEDGHLDRNAIADRYAMVYFGGDDGSGKEGSGFGAAIRVALPDGEDVIHPDAMAWISIVAG